MLTLIYKIISKLLATRFKPFLPSLVDAEKTGFVNGRHILDNILAYKVGREFSRIKRFLAFLLKVDFLKAYDRLDHFFLWEVLRALGFSEFFITSVKGLVCNDTLKLHLNGLFTEDFLLEKGVR